jgi:hypothetical protein
LLSVVSFSFEFFTTHIPIESYDSLEMLHPTQPKFQSELILLNCEQSFKTPNSVSRETSFLMHFSCEMVTSATLPSTG